MQSEYEALVPPGSDRVRVHTSPLVNARLDIRTRGRVRELSRARPEEIGQRLAELDREWDVDRALMANFAVLGGLSLGLGLRGMRARHGGASPWLFLFGAQMGFLLLHALVGWCPPLPVLRRLGVRTSREIEAERHALLEALKARGGHPGALAPSP